MPPSTAAVDDQLSVTGSFCTSKASNISYPVKIMFLIDGSGSLQFTDQNRERVVAVQNTINSLMGTQNAQFKIIVFNSTITSTPAVGKLSDNADCSNNGNSSSAVFTNDMGQLTNALANLAQADTVTDYQGALSWAYEELLRDMNEVKTCRPSELGRTKYSVIFVSDGMPDPICNAGCGNDFDTVNFPPGSCGPSTGPAINCLCEQTAMIQCEMSSAANPMGMCNDGTLCDATSTCDDGSSCGNFADCMGNTCTIPNTDPTLGCYVLPNNANQMFGGVSNLQLLACGDYNQPYQILSLVQNIMELRTQFAVGDLRFNTGIVLDPNANPAVIALFGDPAQAIPLMHQMALTGNGQFLEFYGGDQINFLSINLDSLVQNRTLETFFAVNRAARVTESGLSVDTDFDGLSDDQESTLSTDPGLADTDGDGYSDFFEASRISLGYEPKNPCLPSVIDGGPGANLMYRDPASCDPTQAPANSNCKNPPTAANPTGSCNCYQGPNGYTDFDSDSLNDCEEKAIGTMSNEPDTDHDTIPDGEEAAFGTNPLVWDIQKDYDQDTITNGNEVYWHLNPLVQQNESQVESYRYRYSWAPNAQSQVGQTCYDFTVNNVQLTATRINKDLGVPGVGLGVGYNEIRVYVVEGFANNESGPPLIRTACFRPRYVPPSLKVPASGTVTIGVADHTLPPCFKFLPSQSQPQSLANMFDAANDCVLVPANGTINCDNDPP